jgi:hypothetical protein
LLADVTIALNRTGHALAVTRDTPVAGIRRPRVEHMGDGIDRLGVAGAGRDAVGPLKIRRSYIVNVGGTHRWVRYRARKFTN